MTKYIEAWKCKRCGSINSTLRTKCFYCRNRRDLKDTRPGIEGRKHKNSKGS